jgi:hypothetical protein|tara:strand:+ start:1200 stop:2375 length:1176 start_codon:yes stop_codon:yes gene_type:complete
MKKNLIHHLIWALVAVTAFVVGSQLTKPDESKTASPSKSASTRLSDRQSENPDSSPGEKKARTKSSRTSSTSDQPTILSDADITELGEEFRAAKGPIARRLAFSEMLKNLTPENARLMRENIAHLSQDSAEFREFHYAWGSMAGQEAIIHGSDTPKRDMASSLAGWAASDPASAMAYFDTLSPEQQSSGTHMKWGAAFGLADANPQLAAEFAIERFQNGDKEASKMIHIAASAALRSGDREEITSFLAAVPEGEMSIQAHQHAARELAKDNPANTVEWAVDLPEGDGKNHAVGTSFHMWAGRSPEEAAAAIASVPAADRDAATYGYATRVVHDDPVVGVEWASNIQNPEARGRAMIDTGRVFYRKDREAAQEWLNNANLPEESVQKIIGEK